MRMTAKKIIVSFIILLWMPVFASALINHPSDINTARLSMPFLANKGILSNDEILYYAKTFAGTVQVHKNGDMILYSQSTGQRLVERISGAGPFVPKAGTPSESTINLFYPLTLVSGKTRVDAFNHILMPDIYPHISMKLKAYGQTVEKIFIVNPGGHSDQIQIDVDGAHELKINSNGQLTILPQGIRYSTPKAYQVIDNQQIAVNVCFRMKNKTSYGFEIDSYNPDYPLIIDPFIAGTFFGGDNADEIEDVAVASNGDVYVAGTTISANVPVNQAASGYSQSFNPITHKEDMFIARFNSNLSTLLSATFIGGSEPDTARAIAIDLTGNIIVCGQSLSSDFPIAQSYKGEGDIVVIRMSNDLSNLLSAKFFGGSKVDMPEDMVINPVSKNIYIAGYTQSSDFDKTQYQTFGGITDGFVANLKYDLSSLDSVIYLGGTNDDKAFSLIINSSKNIIVGGQTYSSNFPVKTGSYDLIHNGNMDGFVCEISTDLGTILYSTFLGGDRSDIIKAIVIDNNDQIYVSGTTSSQNFPITNAQNSYDNVLNGTDIFVARFDVHLENLEASTFLGGTSWENATDMLINANNEIMVAGITVSSDFPTLPGTFDQNYNGAVDTFVVTFNPELSALSSATYLGDISDDRIGGIAIQNENIVIAGTTWSSNLYISNTVFDSTFSEREGFITILSQDLGGTLRIISDSDSIHVTMSEDGKPTDFSLTLSAENDLQGEINWQIFTDAAHGHAMASGPGTEKSITYTPELDWYGTDSFIVEISDMSKQHFDRIPVYVHIKPVSDPPVFSQPGQTFSVNENSPKDYSIGTIEASDPDILISDPGTTSLTFSILSGNSGEAFKIMPSTGILSINNDLAVDYEQYTKFTLEIAVANKSYSTVDTINVLIMNQNDAPTINNQQFSLLENSPVDAIVGTVIAKDADGNTLHYRITSGNTNNTFAISSFTGVVTVANNEKLNYEGELKTFDLDIEVSDGDYTATALITVVLTDSNDRPIILDQSFNTNENNVTSTFPVLANDADNNTLTYQILAGNSGGAFTINEQTGMISVQNINQLDYELYQTFTLTVGVNDGTYTETAIVKISLDNLNDNPPQINNQTFYVNENSEGGTIVGTVVATDPDNLFISYRISKPLDCPFLINTTSGLLTVNSGNFLDCETTCAYTITVAVSDSHYTSTGLVIVKLNDINESAPHFTNKSFSFSVKENSIANTLVGQATAIDGDPADTLTYAIISGNAANNFLMDTQTGKITVHAGAKLDWETIRTYVLGLRVSDGIHTDTANAEIKIENINDNPPIIETQTWYINENTPNGTIVGTVRVNDPDEDTQSFSIKSGNTNFAFGIIESNGNIMVSDYKQLDYEYGPGTFILTIVTSDGIFSDEGIIVINVKNTNDNSPLVKNQTFYVDENKRDNTWIGTIVANDDDPADTITYEIISGNTDNAFKVDSITGKLSVNGDKKLNYENIPQYELLIRVSDGTNAVSAIVTVILNEKNDPPTVSDQILSVEENKPEGTVIGQVSARDDDVGDTLFFSISAGTESNPFQIDSQGNISIKDAEKIDYETLKTVNLVVTVTDGEVEVKASIVVNVKDVNDPPVITNQTFNIDEDIVNTSYVGTVVASDEDRPLNILTYNILSGNDNNAFVLHESTGVMRVNDTSVIDYEKQDQYVLTVQVDDGQARKDAEITINIRNANDNSPQVENLSVTVDENKPNGYAIGHVVATDADNDVLSYRIISGNTNLVFAFSDTNSGTITVQYGNLLNYELVKEYQLVVEVSDSYYKTTASVIVTVNNLNDNVPVIQKSTLYVNEDVDSGFNMGKVFAQDQDNDPLSYSIVQALPSNPFMISPTTGELYVSHSLDYESDPAYTLTVMVSDGLYSASAPIIIRLNNVNDNAPLFYDQTFTIKENASIGDEVGQLMARDLDNDVFAFYFTSSNSVFAIDPGTGVITVIENSGLNNDKPQYDLSVKVQDDKFTSYAVLTILVLDGNDNRVVFDQTFSVQENSPQNTLLGKITVDAPPGTRQYIIVSGNSNDAFTLNPDTGELTVNKPSELDFELMDTYVLKLIATINGAEYQPTLTIKIKDANEYPPIFDSGAYHFYVDENSNDGALVGSVNANDLDTADILQYKVVQGKPSNPFNLELNSGQLTVNGDYLLNYEHVPEYTLTISVTDGKHDNQVQVIVSLNDRNEFPPEFASETFAYTISENIATGSYVGKILASDEDPGSTLIYLITAGNDQKIFQIDNTGNFSIDDADGLDFETQSAYTLTVQISDGLYNDTAQILVKVTNINDPPEILLSLYPRIPSIRGGSLHSVMLNNSGQIFTVGENQHGQLGDDTMIDKKIPVPIYGIHDFVKMDSKYLHTIALQNDSSVWTWGWNNKGQLGNGQTTDLFAPFCVDGLTRVKGIAAGAYHTMVLLHDGNVKVWGSNSYGQLGDGTLIERYRPVAVNNLENIKGICAGYNHSMAILDDNSVMAWGQNNAGQVGDNTFNNKKLTPVKVSDLVNVIALAAGKEHSMALKKNGTVWTWGSNDKGQLGTGTTQNENHPVLVEPLSDIIAIAAGGQHSLALRDDGTIWIWGLNNQGQLGNGTMITDANLNYETSPIKVKSNETFIAISAGENHSIALSTDGTVWAWGDNSKGQLGNNSIQNSLEPQKVNAPNNLEPLNIGQQEHPKITIKEDNQSDYLLFEIRDSETPVQNLSVTADADDPVLVPMDQINIDCIDGQCQAMITPSQNDFGETLVHFRVSDGEKSTVSSIKLVVESTNDPPSISEIADQRTDENITSSAISFKIDDLESAADNLILLARSSNLVLVPEDQIVFGGSGKNRFVTITPGNNQSGIAVITLTVRDQSEATSMSFNFTVNAAPDISDIGDMTIAEDQSTDFINFEVSDSESDFTELTIVGFASDPNMVPDQNIQVNCSSIGCTLLIKPNPDQSGKTLITLRVTDGHAVSEDTFLLTIEPGNDPPEVEIDLEAGNPAIAAGAYHSLAVRGGNEVMAWGRNDIGQLGIGISGENKGQTFPHIVNGMEKIVDLAAGENHSMALSNDGKVWTWGNNSHGQLGIGNFDNTQMDTPQNIILTDIIAIDAGYAHSLALQDNGNVWSWGSNSNGQLGNGTYGMESSENKPDVILTLDNCVAIAAGYAHSVALKKDGTVWTWGFNSSGQLGDQSETDKYQPVIVPGLANVIAIAAGDYHTVALKSDGTVWTWGDNPFGQLGDGTKIMKNTPVRVLDISNVTGIAAGYGHTLALRNDGYVWGWGSNMYGQLGNNSNVEMYLKPVKADIYPHAISVEAGHYHSLVLKSDGSVWSFGANGFGQLGNNTLQGTAQPVGVNNPDNIGKLNIGKPYTIDEDDQTGAILFSVTDEETPSEDLFVSVSSSNPRLVPDSSFIKEGTGKIQSLTIRPAKNQFGWATITIKVTDGISFSTDSFTLWVNEINDAPKISDIGYQSIDEDTQSDSIPFQISDMETPADQLLVSATSSNPTLIPNANIQIIGTGQARNVLITPAKDIYGIATITISVSDNVVVVSDTFTVRVKDVNDAPAISQIADQITDEDTPLSDIKFVVSDMETPSANLIMSASTSDPSKVPLSNLTFSGTDQNRELTIMPLPDQNGTVQITIHVSDGTLSSQESFILTIAPVDDAPRISSIENQETWEYIVSIPVSFTVTDAETPADDLIFTAVSSDTLIVSNNNITFGGSGNERTVIIKPSEEQFGTTDITIAVDDGNNTKMETFSLTVNPQRDWDKNENIITYSDLEDIWGRSANDIFAVGNGGTIFHYNGISWTKMVTTYDYDLNAIWGDVSMVYVVGNSGVILQYNGHSWSKMFTGTTQHLNGIWGNGRSVFAVGTYGTILKHNGVSWSEMSSGTTTELLDIWGNENVMYAVGRDGMVLQYNGYVWDTMSKITLYPLRGVWGSSENDVFAVGDAGVIIHYNGTEWIEQERGDNSLKGIWGLSSNVAFATGLQGTILSYDGNAWSQTESGVAYPLMGIWGASITDIYVVGENGTILRRSTGQISGKITTNITGGNAIVVGASVSIVETGQHTTTDENGRYVFDNVPIGAYTVKVSSEYFSEMTISDVLVPGGEISLPDIDLSDLKTGVYTQSDLDNAVYKERIKYDPDGDGVISTENIIYFLQWLGGF